MTSIFDFELNLITDQTLRDQTVNALKKLPNYFWVIPSSSTGKYHPSYALDEGGLVRHSKAAARIAVELSRVNDFEISQDELNQAISALIVHDGFKNGTEGKYTVASHPVICGQILESVLPEVVVNLIKSHMGQWNREWNTGKIAESQGEPVPTPQTKLQKFVHLCDYIASRKCLEFNFNVPLS
jgi:hypothetical protein